MSTRNPSLTPRLRMNKDSQRSTGLSAQSGEELCGERPAWWWTGKQPALCPGFSVKEGVLRSLPMPTLQSFTREEVLDYFDNCWTQYELLLASLQGCEAFFRSPYHQLRHPMIFYYGHPAVLYINKFRVAGLLDAGINQVYEQLFETGVDEMSWDDLSFGRDDWPTVEQTRDYRKEAYLLIRSVLETHPCLESGTASWDSQGWAVFLAFEHDRIHLETSSVLIRELPLELVRRPQFWPDYHPSARQTSAPAPKAGVDYPINDLVKVAAEHVELGKHMAYPSFGWDNEYGHKVVDVPAFKASKFKVTNGEFLEFVKSGGYTSVQYWSKEGWGWRTFRNVKWPTFWAPDGPAGLHQYKLRLLFDVVAMRWDWPVDANYHEAQAFCAWRAEKDGVQVAYRLITEAEHMLLRNTRDRADAHKFTTQATFSDVPKGANGVLASSAMKALKAVNGSGQPVENGHDAANGHHSDVRHLNKCHKSATVSPGADPALSPDLVMMCSGHTAAQKFGVNFQLAYSSQSPVNEMPPSEKGFYDVFGNCWEWAEDHFAAFPGFKLHPYYDDFSTPCFGGKHQLILGGSFISTGHLASKWARYQFRPHFFQHAGFRVVASTPDLSLYDLNLHGSEKPILPYFPTSCMDAAPPYVGTGPCCTKSNLSRFTPTVEGDRATHRQKLGHAQATYESDALMAQYLSLHYGPLDSVFPSFVQEGGLLQQSLDFPAKCGAAVISAAEKVGAQFGRALDIGCAVGGASFEMATRYEDVVGIDISATFIDAANMMKEVGSIAYNMPVEAALVQPQLAQLPARAEPSKQRVTFLQGDACNLPHGIGKFDAVLLANLLCRVPNPQACLDQVTSVLRPGGVAVIISPFSWFAEYTEPSKWLGGYTKPDGTPAWSADGLKAYLQSNFELLQEDSMPLVIREHSRKYQLILSHRLVLRRTSN